MTIQKKIYFKDTLPVLNCKHSALIERFELKDVKRELFLYKYYTFDRLDSNKGTIDEVGVDEDGEWTKEDNKTFNANIDSIPDCRVDENHFNLYKYAEFYCIKDVNYSDKHSINSKDTFTKSSKSMFITS